MRAESCSSKNASPLALCSDLPSYSRARRSALSLLATAPPSPSKANSPATRERRRGPRSTASNYRGVSCYKRTGRWEGAADAGTAGGGADSLRAARAVRILSPALLPLPAFRLPYSLSPSAHLDFGPPAPPGELQGAGKANRDIRRARIGRSRPRIAAVPASYAPDSCPALFGCRARLRPGCAPVPGQDQRAQLRGLLLRLRSRTPEPHVKHLGPGLCDLAAPHGQDG